MRYVTLAGLLLSVSLFAAGPISAQEEAPEALFEMEIGDAEVDFYLQGSWEAALTGSLGFLVDPSGTLIFPSPFPGLEADRTFRQIPNLTFSVWLMQRYFLEASVVGDFLAEDYDYFDQNYLLGGYRGEEGEFLRQVLFGNRDIGIGAYPFIEIPDAGGSSLGASAQLATGISAHELLLRFDNNEQDRIVFIGKNRVSEQTISLDEYQRGRFFRLPDEDVGGLKLYLEDPDGPLTGTDYFGHGRRYRLATAQDAAVDAATGSVALAKPAEGSVLVYYTDSLGAAEVGDPTLGSGGLPGESGLALDPASFNDFSWTATSLGQPMVERQVIVGAEVCLRLYEPGEFSPFEILGAYTLEEGVPGELSRLRVSVVRKGSASLEAEGAPRARLTPGADYVTLELGSGTKYRRAFYPFLDALDADPVFDPDNRLYGPRADAPAGYLDYEILVSHLTPVSDYRIGTDLVPGSVRVFRNGVGESRFEVDHEQGLLTFFTEIAPNDRLEVHFRRQLSLANNGDLLFAWGSTLAPSEALTVQLAAGLRWNLLPGTFTDEAFTRTGSVVLSAGAEGQSGPLSYKAQAGLSFTNPDTTGTMRLLGMEATGLDLNLAEDTAWPAAVPADDGGVLPAGALDPARRGRLLYKDFRSYGLLGNSTLMSYTWSPPAEQLFEYETGSKPGPYVAAGSFDGTTKGRSLVLDMELDDGEWVGAQLPVLPEARLADLAAYRGISLRYRMVDFQGTGTADCTVYVQLGEIGEDLDGDGLLDAEASASAAGFSFDDSGNGAALRVGSGPKNTGNSRRDSEDVDGNEVLDPEAPGWVVTLPVTAVLDADTGWAVLEHDFSAAERAALRRTRSLRLLVVETGAGADVLTGRLLVDRLSLEGSPFSVDVTGGLTATVREVEEQLLPSPPSPSLEEAHAEVADVFHPFGERQKVLAVTWEGGSADSWQVNGYIDNVTGGIDYRDIVYYYHKPDADGSTLSFALTDAEGDGVTWTLPATATTRWAKVRVSVADQRVYVDGQEAPGGTVSGSLKGVSARLFTVALDAADAGTLYLDELHLTDPRGAVGAGVVVDLQLDRPGELVSVGGHSLVRDLSVREQASATTSGFSGLYGAPLKEGSFSSRTEVAAGLSIFDLAADLSVRGSGGEVDAGGGHRLAVPHQPFPLRFADTFRLEQRAGGAELSRGNSLSLDLAPVAALDLETTAGSLEDTLSQRWLARLLLTPGPLSLDNRLELSEAAEGFEIPEPEGGYLANWLLAWGLLAPWRGGDPLERKGSLAVNWDLATAPVGLQALGSFGFHSFDLTDPSRSLRGSLALDLSLPVTWRAGQVTRFSLTPGYRRSLSLRGTEAGSGDFAGDLDSSLAWLFAQDYAFAGLPFLELFDADLHDPAAGGGFVARTASFAEARFEAESYLRLARRASSRLLDLVVPSAMELALGRTLERAGDLTTDLNQYSLSSRTAALNLFGSLGAYSLFPFYRTDEFSSSVSVTLRADEGHPEDGGLLVEHFASFEGQKGGLLTLSNRYSGQYESSWSAKDTVELLYTWERRPPEGVRLPLLPASLGQEAYWTHEESVQMTSDGDREDESYHPVNLILTHETTLVLPEHGFAKASLGVGYDREKTADKQLYQRFGLRGGLEVRIEF